MRRINYKNVILKEFVTPKLREQLERLDGNILYNYPKTCAKFPLIVLNITDTPSAYQIGADEIVSDITVKASVLDTYQSDCMDLEYALENIMFDLGFTRLSPSEPYKNEIYDKFQIDVRFKIRYNAIMGGYERIV